jgi:tryptophan halogenase
MNERHGGVIEQIVIAGNGLEAWLAAATLAKSLDGGRTKITVCPVSGSDALDALYTILPSHPADRLRALGISDLDLARDCDAAFSLGTRISGTAIAPGQLKPYGPVGLDFHGIDFHHHWLRTDPGGQVEDYFSYAPGTHAMAQHKFAHPTPRNAIGALRHEIARQTKPLSLKKLFRSVALHLGAAESGSELSQVRRVLNSDRIECLVTAAGERLEAHLFIDCSGPERKLALKAAGQEWVQNPLSPEYDIEIENISSNRPPPPFSLVEATGDGWNLDIPTGTGQININLRSARPGNTCLRIIPGNITRPFHENCLALGIASAIILPVDPLQAIFLMTGLGRLVHLLPGSDCSAAETGEFNKLTLSDLREVHWMTGLYELARKHESLEVALKSEAVIDAGLRKRLELFKKRGWIAPQDSDLLAPSCWSSAFIALGLIPERHDRRSDRVPAHTLQKNLHELRENIQQVVAGFPSHADYLNAARSSTSSRG